jgi:hypothetical protein
MSYDASYYTKVDQVGAGKFVSFSVWGSALYGTAVTSESHVLALDVH